MQFASIRDVNTNANYIYFIHALASFNYGLTGIQQISSQHEARKNLLFLMQDNRLRTEKGKINQHFIQSNMGATKRVLSMVG